MNFVFTVINVLCAAFWLLALSFFGLTPFIGTMLFINVLGAMLGFIEEGN